jgi:hypothetical protein
LIKGIKKLFKDEPKAEIIIHAGRIRLSDFFLVGFLSQKTSDLRIYQKLRERVEQYNLETELCYLSSVNFFQKEQILTNSAKKRLTKQRL